MDADHVKIELKNIFNKQRAAFYNSCFPTLTQRINLLNRLQLLLLTHKEAMVEVLSQDFGQRARYETVLEIFSILQEIKYAKRHLKTWMKERKKTVSFWYQFAYAKLMPQPLGVIGIIAAWNGPLNLTLSPLIGALAAGNRAMIKTSETAPMTANLLKKIVSEYFNEDEVAIIIGDSSVSNLFATLPFDHLLFTGSTHVARLILNAASLNLTPVTLELGGKSPVIIAKDVNLELAVKKIILVKLFNAGQVCLAPDYILLPKGQEETFLTISRKIVNTHYPCILQNADYTNIINAWHMERLQAYLDDARAKGAEIIPLANEDKLRSEKKFIPVAILGVKPTMRIMQEEIFGPLLPLISYEHIQNAIDYINARDKPLGLYYFGRNKNEANYVLKNTYSGGATVNDVGLHFCQTNLPFGGVGASGMGHYHGEYGFQTFSKLKPVCYQRRWNFIPLFYPPYGKLIKLLTKIMLR